MMSSGAPSHRPHAARSKTSRARQYLKGGGVSRGDSDDELGLEDHPWEWIFAEVAEASQNHQHEGDDGPLSRKRRAISADDQASRQIIGARMGEFTCRLGDCVLLKAEGNNEAWLGLICAFLNEDDDEDSKAANFMWFSSEKEIRNKEKKRTDFMEVRFAI